MKTCPLRHPQPLAMPCVMPRPDFASLRLAMAMTLASFVSSVVLGLATVEARGDEASEAKTVTSQSPQDSLDWPFWRGPRYDGVSSETGLIDRFDAAGGEGSNVLWKREDLGTRSTPIAMGGKLYVLARADRGSDIEGEKVVCLDAMTGATLWENRFNVWLSDVPDTRVAWSSVVGDPETGNVYALGVCGYFQCLEGNTGKTLWSVPMHERFGLLTTYGGRTTFPVICEDLVIASGILIGWGEMARPAFRLVAFDKRTGEVMWYNGTLDNPYDTVYSAPTVTVLDGQKAIVCGSGDGHVWAFQPRTGRPIWRYEISRRGLNISPLVVGDTVYMGHSEENEVGTAMGTVIAINGAGQGDISKTGERWRVFELMMGKSSPVLWENRLYCVSDQAKLHVLDADTGEAIGKRPIALGRMMRSSPLIADGKLYAVSASGDWFIFRLASGESLELLSKGRFPGNQECDASPICSHGCVYMTTSGGIYCLRDPDQTPGVEARPAEPAEASLADQVPAQVQVVPAEVLLRSGESQVFRTRVFNARGQFLQETAATYSVAGAGTIDAEGIFHAGDEAEHRSAIISATVGELVGQARVRIVPPLPWQFTFDNLSDPPVTWVGARYRHVIREEDGNRVMVKVTTVPKGTRSRCWFGPTDLSDYTIEAEVRGAVADGKMPDIGIVAQGYTLDLQGASQKLQIRSWDAQLRMAKTIDFAWQPNTWYVMKLRAENQHAKAVLRGKVWPRDQTEPAEWTIYAEDKSPNVAGSPGLFGNANDAEITLDNLKVYNN